LNLAAEEIVDGGRAALVWNRAEVDLGKGLEELDGEVRVSSLQTGLFCGPVGTTVGQHRFHPDARVREAQENVRLYTPCQGLIEVRARAIADPHAMVALSAVFLVATLGAVVVGVFWRVHRETKRWPSLNMLVPYVAMYLWWVPLFMQSEFYMYVVPVFHSLQYLPFVYKLEPLQVPPTLNVPPPQVRPPST